MFCWLLCHYCTRIHAVCLASFRMPTGIAVSTRKGGMPLVSRRGYASPMPRPSRTEEAKAVITGFYAEHGVMPTIGVLAEAMAYRSTSSAHNTVMGLVREGYLSQDQRGGRLLPGPGFARPGNVHKAPSGGQVLPPEIASSLPAGVELTVLEVPDSSLVADAICAGDMLVLAPLSRTDLSDLLVQSRGSTLAVGNKHKSGWKLLGVLVAQFRRYHPRA